MRTKQTLLTLLLSLIGLGTWADESKIIVWLNDNTKTEIPFEKMPEFMYADGTVSITVDETKYSWPLANLKEFTFESSLSTFFFSDTEINSLAMAEKDGSKCNFTLNRTLKTGCYNTLALPFDVSADKVTAILGSGAKVKKLTGSSLDGETLTLTFADAVSIEAGKPYLVKVAANVEAPTFEGVVISNTITPTITSAVDFIPTLGKTTIEGDAKNVLFLGDANTLYSPTELPSDIKGFRAYFQLKAGAATARSFHLQLDGETTGIQAVPGTPPSSSGNSIYDLQGRRVPAHRQRTAGRRQQDRDAGHPSGLDGQPI